MQLARRRARTWGRRLPSLSRGLRVGVWNSVRIHRHDEHTIAAGCAVSRSPPPTSEIPNDCSLCHRSPVLACLTGGIGTLRSCSLAYMALLSDYDLGGQDRLVFTGAAAVCTLIGNPASLIGNLSLILWVVRLLVLYDPPKRKTYGRYVQEKLVVRALGWVYVWLQVVVWGAASSYGVTRTSTLLLLTLDPFTALLMVVACVLLGDRLKRVQDLGGLSQDAAVVRAWVISMLFAFTAISVIEMPVVAFKYCYAILSVVGFHVIVWRIVRLLHITRFLTAKSIGSNVRPVREFLQLDKGGEQDTLRWFFPGWINHDKNIVRVACTSGSPSALSTSRIPGSRASVRHHENPLASVMGFLPLKEAFGEFCRKALCSESFQFLVDASEYRSRIIATHGNEATNDDFDGFISIVNEYIKDNSNSEINIDYTLKNKIVRIRERSAYDSLGKVAQEGIFQQAAKEIAKILADNLLSKFKATAEYSEITADILF